jgi:hypothetical protein
MFKLKSVRKPKNELGKNQRLASFCHHVSLRFSCLSSKENDFATVLWETANIVSAVTTIKNLQKSTRGNCRLPLTKRFARLVCLEVE